MATTGIDYGMGQTNIDRETGIRYGVIPANDLGQSWFDAAEGDYGPPTCPKCGSEADEPSAAFGDSFAEGRPDDYTSERYETDDYVCVNCQHFFGSESAFGDEPLGYAYTDDGYQAVQNGGDSDVFVIQSPFYTFAPFCSPCAPGAGYLPNGVTAEDKTHRIINGEIRPTLPRVYCFGHDWFEDGKAPYRVFRVDTCAEVFPE